MERIVRYWNRLASEVTKPPFLKVFETQMDVALGDIV